MERLNIIRKQLTQTIMRQIANIPPISSEIAAMIKSLDTIGILFGSPCPSPKPNSPPVPMAKSDWHT